MKRVLSFVLILSLLLSCCVGALAAGITITQQPQTQTVKAGGNVTFKVKAKNAGGAAITWYFSNPATGESTTGRKLAEVVPGVKVSNPNTLSIKLRKVPEELHGWTLYCHIGPKGGGVDSDTVMILIAGKEPPVMPTPAPKEEEAPAASSASRDAAPAAVSAPAATKEPAVIRGSKVELYKLDQKGNIVGEAQKELTFEEEDADFYVKLPEGTEGTIQYILLNSLRLTPEGEVTGMSVRGWSGSASVRVKVKKPGDEENARRAQATEEPVDESQLVTITCTNCRFTGWHNSFAESGKVPVGSTIKVIASGGFLKKGYSVNGGASEHKNQASFSLVVEGDTTITMEDLP